jgi:hypothetical protein
MCDGWSIKQGRKKFQKLICAPKTIETLFILVATLSLVLSLDARVVIGGGTVQAQTQTLTELPSVPASGIFYSVDGKLPPSPFDPLPQCPVYAYGPIGNQVAVFIIAGSAQCN